MNGSDSGQTNNNSNVFESFFIHFDLNGNKHEVPIQQSIITEQSIYTIIQELNKQLFNNELDIKILVYPPDEGGFLKNFGLIFLSLVGANIVNGAVMGLGDGRTIDEYTRDGITRVGDYYKTALNNFLQKKNQDLTNAGISYDTFYKAYDAKNKFYQAALENTEIKNIGFVRSDEFSVSRNEFAYRIVDLKSKTSKIDPVDKFHKLIVISSINTIEDSKLTWHVKDEKIKKRFEVYMADEDFYRGFLSSPILIKKLLVKMRYHLNRDENGDIQVERKEVITVYEYNDIKIYDLPKDAKIEIAPWNVNQNILSIPDNKPDSEGSLFEGFME